MKIISREEIQVSFPTAVLASSLYISDSSDQPTSTTTIISISNYSALVNTKPVIPLLFSTHAESLAVTNNIITTLDVSSTFG